MKRLTLILLLLAAAFPVAGRRYPFIRPRALEAPAGSSVTFELFRRKMDTLVATGRGDVRVLHVGGSHVQGGTWSDRLRCRFLAQRYGMDGGRGLVFPFAAALTNTPVSYTTSYSGNWATYNCLKDDGPALGIAGIAAVAQDTSARVAVDLAPKDAHVFKQHYAFNRVDLLGEGELEPLLLLQGRDTVRGVSGRGVCHFDLPYYTDWLQLLFRGSGTYTVRGLYLDRSTGGFTYSEAGVNGASTTAWTRCSLWADDLRRLRPDLVIFSIGINDIQGQDFDVARFKGNYRRLIGEVRKANPYCAILFSGINDSYYRGRYVNPHTQEAENAFRELAREYKGVFWDLYAVMGGSGSSDAWREAGLMQGDRVHFTPEGYRLVGDMLFDAIIGFEK